MTMMIGMRSPEKDSLAARPLGDDLLPTFVQAIEDEEEFAGIDVDDDDEDDDFEDDDEFEDDDFDDDFDEEFDDDDDEDDDFDDDDDF